MYEVALTHSYMPAQNDDVVRETTVPGILREAAAAAPEAIALVEADAAGDTRRRWRYRDLLADSERLARGLAARFAPGERIAVWAPNIPEWVILEFASGMAGLTLVTVNPAYQVKELRYVLEQSRASGLFLVRSFRGNPMAGIAARATGNLPIRLSIDMEDSSAFYGTPGSAPLPDVAPGDAAQIQYTSGTTGFPKGAVLSHRGLTNNSRFFCSRLGVREGDTYLNVMPMFHTAGCSMGVLGSVQHRAQMILPLQFDGAAANRIVARERVAVAMGVPTMLI